MTNIDKLEKLINLSENTVLDSSIYGETLGILACNSGKDIIDSLNTILQESVPDKEFAQILNSVHEHLHNMYEISEMNLSQRRVRRRKRESKTDPQKSRLMKMVWKKNKGRMMKGLGRFHKSSKGKTFEKALSKFVSSRTKKQESADSSDVESLILGLNELRISLSSAVTQLLIGMKSNPENYVDFSSEDFNELVDVFSEAMKDLQDAYISRDPEKIEDVMDEVIAEFASVLVGIKMDFIYDNNDNTTHNLFTK